MKLSKILSLIIAAVIVLGIASCGAEPVNTDAGGTQAQTTLTNTTASTEPAQTEATTETTSTEPTEREVQIIIMDYYNKEMAVGETQR